MSLVTTWCESMGLRAPIVNAPMGGAAGGLLATAVSAAGGLGMIGMGSAGTADALTAELRLAQGTFGIGLVHWVMTERPELLDVALDAEPALLSVSFGDSSGASAATGNVWEWVQRAHDAGVLVTTQVASVEAARRAVDAGVDVVVARGAEGGGHGEPLLGILPLLTGVLDAVDVPVVAAGGISSPRGLAAVLAAGASAAWLGTVFAACPQALTSDAARAELLAGAETELTSRYDLEAGYRWPTGIPERVLRGSPVNAGQGVGQVHESVDAGELVAELCSGAEELLSRQAR